MIVYSENAKKDYIANIEKLQKQLGNVSTDVISYMDLHWLIHTALNDLKKQVEKE